MNYIEWLRVRNCLRTVAIILVVLVVLAVVLRISFARYASPATWVANMTNDPTAKATHSVLADGTKRTVIDDPADRTHVVIDDRGSAGSHIVVTEPSSHSHDSSNLSHVGNVVSSHSSGGITTTVIDSNGSVPMIFYMALADIVALIVATILAAPFAREIDGHLEIALTRPCSRLRFALGSIGVDAVGILASSLLTIVALYLCQLLFETWRLDFTGENGLAILMGMALPLAWYAMLCAATTWLSRSYGAVLGFAWPVALLIGGLTRIEPSNAVAVAVHDVAWGLSRFIPLTYVHLAGTSGLDNYAGLGFEWRISAEILFFLAYGALAIWQWQRVEA
ncbi:MAG: hypothetical protein WBE79_07345 [Candidatus Cybelea sp.]